MSKKKNRPGEYGFGKHGNALLHAFYNTKEQQEAERLLRQLKSHITSFEQANRVTAFQNLPQWKASLVNDFISQIMNDLDRLPTAVSQ